MRIKSRQGMPDGTFVVKEATPDGVVSHTFEDEGAMQAFLAGEAPKKSSRIRKSKKKGSEE